MDWMTNSFIRNSVFKNYSYLDYRHKAQHENIPVDSQTWVGKKEAKKSIQLQTLAYLL